MLRKRTVLMTVLALSLVMAACGQSYQFKGTPYPEGQVAPDFQLTAEDGSTFRLSDERGKVVLMFFGYTSCPDICPTTLAEAKQVLDGLGQQIDQVDFLFITVDPERDTPEKLASYTDIFHPAILGLTGDPDTLATVRDGYGVTAIREETPDSALGYIVNHTARIFLVDPQGDLRLSYGFSTPPADIVADVEHLVES